MTDFIDRTKVRRVGDSLAVLLPKKFLKRLKIERGDQLLLGTLNEETLTLTKVPFEFREKLIRA